MEVKDKVRFKEGDEGQIQNKRREDRFKIKNYIYFEASWWKVGQLVCFLGENL
jgi:hypothetical protein